MAHCQYRKTRIVCVSDTHNTTPPLPKGDVLIHAGDLTNQGTLSELERAIEWISKAPYEVKIVIAGNHDITLDLPFYTEHGLSFHNQHPQDPLQCIDLVQKAQGITYLNHTSKHIRLTDPAGPQTHFRVFGSPYSPDTKGDWAFRYAPDSAQATQLWSQIPPTADIVVTHTPPHMHCDRTVTKAHRGCEELRRALWRVRPKLLVCGHLHEGRGVEKVRWSIDDNAAVAASASAATPLAPFAEESTRVWVDPGRGDGNRKLSAVDLTAAGNFCLDHGGSGVAVGLDGTDEGKILGAETQEHVQRSGDADAEDGLSLVRKSAALKEVDASLCGDMVKAKAKSKSTNPRNSSAFTPVADDRGTNQVWSRNDMEARLGRRETCIVNAAIMANSWGGPKRFNKPIVVSIDLPVWEDWGGGR